MGSKIDRTGEKGINNFGSEMVIVNSYMEFNDKHKRNYTYFDVYFPKYNWTFEHVLYNNFKKGNIKCPYERRYYEVGYLGEGKYDINENGKHTKCYNTWHDMLKRCYDENFHKRQPTYIDCNVSEEWHNFQNFAKWYYENYYEIEGQKMCLDKDILMKYNKIYSPDTCVFVPNIINVLFTKNDKNRGNNPIGVFDCEKVKYRVECSVYNFDKNKKERKYLGVYDTQEEAFEVYKEFKERYIKKVADYYKDKIPDKLYQALYNYEVEITD